MKACDGTTDIQLYKIRTEFLPLLRHNWVICPVRYRRSIVAGLFELGLVYHSRESSSISKYRYRSIKLYKDMFSSYITIEEAEKGKLCKS